MTMLESLLRPAAAMINREIGAKTPARALCAELDGRVFAMRVPGSALALYLVVEGGGLVVTCDYTGEPDVVVSGSPLALARLAGPAGEDLLRDGAIDIEGDAVLAGRFRKLLRYGRPDLEEALSGLVGDVAAHGVGEFFRGLGRWSGEATETLRRDIGEYLVEERRAVPGRHEVQAFRRDVSALRDDVARFEARLSAVERGQQP